MISTSAEFRRKVAGNSAVLLRAAIDLADGTRLDLSGADLVLGGTSVTEATSTVGSFDVGAAVTGTCDLTLDNHDERFDPYDFTGAALALHVGAELESGTEWILRGTYNVEQPDSYGSTIGLHCLDNLSLLERPYSLAATSYPARLRDIVRDACAACGLDTASDDWPNSGYVVGRRPDEAGLTCLEVVARAAQAAGCFAACDPQGRVSLRWYDTTAYEGEGWLDGGTYEGAATPYADGDAAYGGAFMYGGGSFEGGAFAERPWAYLAAHTSLTVGTDDVVVTGVRVTASGQTNADGTAGADGETALFGSEGYVLAIEGNPLVEYGRAQEVAAQVGAAVVGMRFRPLDATGLASPAWQAGDPLLVVDARQRMHRAWLTSYTWKAGGYASLSCGAKAPARNSAGGASAATRAVVAARGMVRAERTARQRAMEQLERELAGASGLYETTEPQSDGSTVYYLHDKPSLGESAIVWKLTADALGLSTDGGRTYPYGLDVGGTAILSRIYAIGLDADHITSGTIASRDGSISLDLDTGTAVLGASTTLGDRTAKALADQTDGLSAMVRAYGDGVLVCRNGSAGGALVNADGSFDVVGVTWSNGVPTKSHLIGRLSDHVYFYTENGEMHIEDDCLVWWNKQGTEYMHDVLTLSAGSSFGKWYLIVGERPYGQHQGTGACSTAMGLRCAAEGDYSFAYGDACWALNPHSLAFGHNSRAEGDYSAAFGQEVHVATGYMFGIGKYNVLKTNYYFVIGCGTKSSRADAFYVDAQGKVWCKGTLTQNSDRRLKEHHAYLGEDACEFVRALRPALYTKDGERHVGFYAQDVAAAEPEGWGTSTVRAQHTDESLGFDPLTLEYTALIAPLVTYAQRLEARVEELERRVAALERAAG